MSVALIVETDDKFLAKAAENGNECGMDPIAVHSPAETCQHTEPRDSGQEKTGNSLTDPVWQSTFDAVQAAVWVLDTKQRVIRCNRGTESLLGIPPYRVLGRRCWEVVHGTSEPPVECPVRRMLKTLRRESLEFPLNGKWFEVVTDPILNASDECMAIVHIITDITDRKHAEEALHSANKQLKKALHQVKQLQGILPICMYCHKIRLDQNVWQRMECYISEHSEAKFSHGICPDCTKSRFRSSPHPQ